MIDQFVEYVSKRIAEGLWSKYLQRKRERDAELIALTDVFGAAEPLLKYFVEPNCQNVNPANYNEDEPDAVVRTPIFDFLNQYLNREFVVQGDGRNQLFILSDAGLGKTSLLLMIKLCNLLPDLGRDFEFQNRRRVELVKLDAQALGVVRTISNKSETILLLDALDEDPLAWQKPERRLRKVLQASSGFRRVIISCRTQFFPEKGVSGYGSQEKISIGGYVCPLVFLSLFCRRQVLDYLEKRFPGSQRAALDKRQRATRILEQAKSLSFRPFLLSHIEDLLDEGEANDWTERSLYKRLVAVWIQREVRKKSARMSESDLSIACIAIASKMQEQGARHLSRVELEKIVRSIPEVESINGIQYGSKSLLNRNSKGEYRFSHFSIQEYFLSEYILALSHADDTDNRIRRIPVKRSRIRLTRKALEFISYSADPSWDSNEGYLLNDLQLDGFDFSGGDWSNCNFRSASLRDANLENGNFHRADFTLAKMGNSVLRGAKCSGAVFEGADLSDANLEGVRSEGAIFTGVNFERANLRGLSDLGRSWRQNSYANAILPNGKRSST